MMVEKMAATETLETMTTFTQQLSQNFIAYICHESCKSYNYFSFFCTETTRFEKEPAKTLVILNSTGLMYIRRRN
jgi:hypothetical protein